MQDCTLAYEQDVVHRGVKGPSPIMLLPHFNTVTGFVVDYMHCVLLGVTRQFVTMWFDSCYHSDPWYIGTRIADVDSKLLNFHPPAELTRTPRSLKMRKFWKASEWRSFLLYYSPFVLNAILPDDFLKHWMLLSWALYQLLQERISPECVGKAQVALEKFVVYTTRLYGKEHVSYNVHQLVHLCDTVRSWACVHLPITNKTKPSTHKYSLSGQPLSTVSSHSYLGVKLDSKLTWTNHVTDITSKSSKCLGMIKRTLGPCKPEVKQTAYNMLIRPKLEYSSPIWNPHTFSQIKSLERVQHSAARFVKNDYRWNTNPADLITALGWPTLERRRIIKQATTFYKILNNIIEITPPPGLLTRSRTRGQYIAPKCRINAMVFSFYPRAIRIWNMIPSKITNIKNPKSFQEAIMELPFTTPHLNCL